MISYAALERVFSAPRLRAYGDPSDRDESDRIAQVVGGIHQSEEITPVLPPVQLRNGDEHLEWTIASPGAQPRE